MANEKRRLIDGNELTDRLNHTAMVAYPNLFPGLLAAVEVVDDSPTVDAEEVVHGRWEPHPGYPGYDRCSACCNCNIGGDWGDGEKWNYCPNCGAKMDGERRSDATE